MNDQSQPNQERLQELINRLVTQIDIERIYLRRISMAEKPTEQLIILIPKSGKKSPSEVQPLINILFEQEHYYTYKLYPASKVKDCIHQGSLRFYTICTAEALLYRKRNSDFKLFPDKIDQPRLLEKAAKDYQKEIGKISTFSQGAQFYLDNKQLDFAAFMLQQATELSYRTIELWEIGVDKITHSIAGHQQYIAPYMPALGELFDQAAKEDVIALSLLDDAYLDVRYKTNYHISLENLYRCQQKAMELIKWVTIIYHRMENAFKETYPLSGYFSEKNTQAYNSVIDIDENLAVHDKTLITQPAGSKQPIEKVENEGDGLLAKIIKELTVYVAIDSIYCFGHRHEVNFRYSALIEDAKADYHHYDLLLITNEDITEVAAQEGQINAMNLPYAVTLIAHSPSSIEKALAEDNRFFHHVLQNGELVYGKALVSREINQHQAEYKSFKMKSEVSWFRRNFRASGFLTSANAALDEGYEEVPVSLFNQCLEQVCLGMIEVFLGYKPNRHKLNHLFNLCNNFSTLTTEIFPRRTEEEKKFFKLLDQSVNDVRFLMSWSVNPADIDLLGRKCKTFLEKAEKLVEEYLETEAETSLQDAS